MCRGPRGIMQYTFAGLAAAVIITSLCLRCRRAIFHLATRCRLENASGRDQMMAAVVVVMMMMMLMLMTTPAE